MQYVLGKNEDEDEEVEVVKVTGNEMYYYGEINNENTLEFVEKFKRLEQNLLRISAEILNYEPEIRVHICSEGGDLFCGFSLMNLLEKSRVRVVTIAQGACCSAATFMLLGGAERRIARNAYILIHQLSSGMWGKYEEMKDEIRTCEKFMKMIRATYMNKTKIPEKKLDRLMKRDIYLEPSKAIKHSIVHAYD
jgi:ATP-dependent protease ClpP protease subunit